MQSQVKYVTPDCTPPPATDHHHCWLISSFPVSLSWPEWYAGWTESSIPVVTTEWCTISLIKTNTRYHCATLPLQQGKARQSYALWVTDWRVGVAGEVAVKAGWTHERTEWVTVQRLHTTIHRRQTRPLLTTITTANTTLYQQPHSYSCQLSPN